MAQPDGILYGCDGVLIPPVGTTAPPTIDIVPSGTDYDVQDRWRQYVSKNLTPSKLARILEDADAGWPYDFFQLCEEILEKDPKMASLFQTRTLAVQGLNREVLPAMLDESATEEQRSLSDEIAKFCHEAIEAANFDELIGDLMDAVPKPFSIDWIHWGLNSDGKIVPQQFQHIPGTHLIWAVKRNEIRIYDPTKPTFISNQQELGEPLPPFTTVRALFNPRKDNALRAGLMRTLCWYYMFKITAFKDFAAWLDRYGMPLRMAKINQQQFLDPTFYNATRTSLRTLGSDGSGVFTGDAEIQIIAAAKQGAEAFDRMIDIVNREAAQLVLGHELSSQSSPGSGQLGITAALEVRQDYLEGDCNALAAIIRRDVFRPMVEWNFGADAVLQGLVPTMWFDFEPPRDLVTESTVLKNFASVFKDFEFSEQQMRDDYGFSRPIGEDTPDDDALVPSAPAPSPFGGGNQPGDQQQPEPPVPPFSRAFSLARRRKPKMRRMPARYSKATQTRIDRIADRSIADAKKANEAVKNQLVGILRSVLAEGGSYSEARAKVVRSYPDLSVSRIEELLKEGLEITALAGRNGG